MGAIEAHGPHLPLGSDSIVAEAVAVRAAEQSPALVAPMIWYGYAQFWRKFAGNISTRPELIEQNVEDIVNALLPFGLTKYIFVNNHSGNEGALETVARRFKEERGLVMAHFYPWRVMASFCHELYDSYARVSGHGSEPNTSVMLYLTPDDVDMSLAVPDEVAPYRGLKMSTSKNAQFEGVPVELFVDMDEIIPSGIMGGDPTVGTAERGKVLVDRTAAVLANFIRTFRDWN
jgi:creatinine amidohydrolase